MKAKPRALSLDHVTRRSVVLRPSGFSAGATNNASVRQARLRSEARRGRSVCVAAASQWRTHPAGLEGAGGHGCTHPAGKEEEGQSA
jgi:hypothetical protein